MSARHLEKHLWSRTHDLKSSISPKFTIFSSSNSLESFFKSNLFLRVCRLFFVILYSRKVEFQPRNGQVCSVSNFEQQIFFFFFTTIFYGSKKRFLPSQHQFGVLGDVLLHQVVQESLEDVCEVFQLAVQRHRQEGGHVSPVPG